MTRVTYSDNERITWECVNGVWIGVEIARDHMSSADRAEAALEAMRPTEEVEEWPSGSTTS